MNSTSLLDTFSIKARLSPVLILFLPLALSIVVWFPADKEAWDFLAGIITAFGIPLLLPEIARDQGKRKESALFKRWGGKPSTQIQRFQGTWLDEPTLMRYKGKLSILCPDIALPSREEELVHPDKADEAYEACSHYLREVTRDNDKFPLIPKENIYYNFRRNLWAMKPAGIALSGIGIVLCAIAIFLHLINTGDIAAITISAVLMNSLLFVLWIFRFTHLWVKVPADAYAERLLEACGVL